MDHPFHYTHSAGFPALLESLGGSLLVSTYQAGKLIAIRSRAGRLSTLLRTFVYCMGIGVQREQVAVATRNAIWFLHAGTSSQQAFDGHPCFFPRRSHQTGIIKTHEIAWGASNRLWITNTQFSCLCTLDDAHSFVPAWRPPFVTELVSEDRCHLNGLALLDGVPKYVTALGRTNEPEGWRKCKETGGVLVDVASDEVLLEGLSMPHSPRVHQGQLYLLESGRGRLLRVNPGSGQVELAAELPGFVRGLSLHQDLAFVGLSRIRETATFDGLEVSRRFGHLQCGIGALDLRSGTLREFLEFHSGVEELFDVAFLPHPFPHFVGIQKETNDHCFVLP